MTHHDILNPPSERYWHQLSERRGPRPIVAFLVLILNAIGVASVAWATQQLAPQDLFELTFATLAGALFIAGMFASIFCLAVALDPISKPDL